VQGYCFYGTRIAVTSDEAAVLRWLDEFLVPSFEAWEGSAADFTVRIRTAASAYAALAPTRPPGALPPLACFALDREVVHHPSWTASGRTVLADGSLGALYSLGERRVDVIAAPAAPAFRAAVMRAVREVAAACANASGERLQLHTAALARAGRGLLVAGPKGAGKTTVLGYLAGEPGARILANDRAFAAPAAEGFEVRGVPTMVSVRPATPGFLPRLARGVPDVERPGHLTLAEADVVLAERGELREPRRIRLSPAQLARQLGAPLAASAVLAAVAFPEAAEDPGAFALERLAPAESARRLPGALFGVDSGKAGPTAFEHLVGASRPAGADRRGLEALAARVPCFSLRIGSARYADPGAARSILATCL
jgi:hypothetical protein